MPRYIVIPVLLLCAFALLLMALNQSLQATNEWPQIELGQPISGLNRPVHLTHAGDGSGRMFVVEQPGTIRIIANGTVGTTPFLDITEKVQCCGEQGLLSVVFPPDYAQKRYVYVNYTSRPDGTTIIARYHLSSDDNRADPASEEILLQLTQPFANHNGGQLAFGPDGYLYIGTGDGGSAGDPQDNAQNTRTLYGKMLRIDVESGASSYAIPPTNPFLSDDAYRDEIWAVGLRNPWRFSFDRQTGDLYIADVGQGMYEEINYQSASSSGGENYGWRCKEGMHDFNMSGSCVSLQFTDPVHEYSHAGGNCSVTGGFVYRGATYPRMQGIYFYGDYCSATIWGLRQDGDSWQNKELIRDTRLSGSLTSFGEDEAGELYVLDYIGGAVYPLIDPAVAVQPSRTGIELAAAHSEQTGLPGAQVMHTLRLTNTGTITDSYGIAIRQATWTTRLVSTIVGPLQAGSSQPFSITVEISTTATAGDSDTAQVVASSLLSPTVQASVLLTTTVRTRPLTCGLYLPLVLREG